MMSDRSRRLRKIGATTAFGLLVFLSVFVLTLPYGRLKDYLVVLGEQQGYDIELKSAGPALGLGIRLKDLTISSRPSGGGKPTRIVVPVAKLRWSLLGALAGRKTYQVSASVFGGDLDVETTRSKSESGLHVAATAIDLSDIPWVKAAINLPLSGTLDLRLDEKMPGLHASATVGLLTWTCSACAVGDGKAKLIIPGNPLLNEGLGLPKIRLGNFVGRMSIDKGVGRLQGVQAKSPDGELYLEGEVRLSDNFALSWLDLYVRFKLNDTLLKSSPKLGTIMQFAGSAGKRPDGFYGFRVSGPLNHLGAPLWTKTSPFGAQASGPKPIAGKAGAPPPYRPGFPSPSQSAQAVGRAAGPETVTATETSSAPAAEPAPPAPAPTPVAPFPGYDPRIDNPQPEQVPPSEPTPPPPPPSPPPPPPPAAEPAPAPSPGSAPPAASDAAPAVAQPPS